MTSTFVDPGTGQYCYGGPIIGRGSYATARTGTMMLLQCSATTSEVEVDTDTGEVTVLEVNEVAACGTTVFWRGEMNQIAGGIAFMVGHALYCGLYKDEATGNDLNANYLHFKCATMADMPVMNITTDETPEPYGPFGAKGSAEPVMPSITPSILNAVYNACGVRATSTQLTPDKILTALGK